MLNLPCLNFKAPSLYDIDSPTLIEMVAKVYGKMNELVNEYNEHVGNYNKCFDVFQVELRQEFQDFIDVVELQLKKYDIMDYQNFIDALNKSIDEIFEAKNTELQETIDYVNNFITDTSIIFNNCITQCKDYIKENLSSVVTELLNEKIGSGEIAVGFVYDEELESLSLLTNLTDVSEVGY